MARLSDFGFPNRQLISPISPAAIGVELACVIAATAFDAPGWYVANGANYYLFTMPSAFTVVDAWCLNGATASGNICLSIYNTSLARQVTTGSVAQSGTSTIQRVALTDTTLPAGTYLAGMSMDNNTGTIFRMVTQSTTLNKAYSATQASAFPLPDPAVPASTAQHVYMFGFTLSGTFPL